MRFTTRAIIPQRDGGMQVPTMVGIGNSGDRTADEVQRRRRRARSFGARAADYAVHRPDYPEAGIRWALEALGGKEGFVVLDLGAGTGKLTAGLLAAGVEVIAVEPDAGMRAELVRLYPGVAALSGAAEAIPLADGTVDAVLAGQAFHHSQRRTAESLTASIGTNSHTVIISAQERADVLGRILDYLHATPETAEGEFEFPLRTEVIRAVRHANTPR
ncbi:class I SAM-dependent methyltransferase [Nocardia fluminea]